MWLRKAQRFREDMSQLWLMAGDKGEQETVKRRVTGGPDWSAVGLGSRKKEAWRCRCLNEAGVTFAEASHLFHLGLESKHRGRNVYWIRSMIRLMGGCPALYLCCLIQLPQLACMLSSTAIHLLKVKRGWIAFLKPHHWKISEWGFKLKSVLPLLFTTQHCFEMRL